jgi:hypothetical protein
MPEARLGLCKIAAHDAERPMPAPDPALLATLATDLKTIWAAPTTDARLKKRIVRTLIQEVVADIDPQAAEIILVVHWIGGNVVVSWSSAIQGALWLHEPSLPS